MADEAEAQFDKADEIIADALQNFMSAGVSQEVFGMALMEVGILALVKLGEDDARIQELAQDFAARAKEGLPLDMAPQITPRGAG